MSKTLVAYFSAESGSTKALAETLAMVTGADKFEIVPAKPYSKADLNYSNPLARCNREQIAKKDVPIAGTVVNMADYDTVLIGFPIWYYNAPMIIKTFVQQYDLAGKKIALRDHRRDRLLLNLGRFVFRFRNLIKDGFGH